MFRALASGAKKELSYPAYTGEATMNFLRMPQRRQKCLLGLGESEGVRKASKVKFKRDLRCRCSRGHPETRRLFAEADWPKAVKLVREGLSPNSRVGCTGLPASSWLAKN